MSWLQGKWIQQISGDDSGFVSAVTSESVVGVQSSGATDGSKDLTDWLAEGYRQQLAD